MICCKRSKQTAILLLILSFLALAAAIISLVDPSIYGDVLDAGIYYNALMPGTLSQDLVSVGATGILIVLAVALLRTQKAIFMVPALGLAGFFLYGYGTYVFAAAYALLYPLYMAIFSLALFALILGFSAFDTVAKDRLALPNPLRIALGVLLLLLGLAFSVVWLGDVLLSSSLHDRPIVYATYALDLCAVTPSLVIAAVLLLRKKSFGVLVGGVLLVFSCFSFLSFSLAGIFVPMFGGEGGISIEYIVATAACVVLIAFYLRALRKGN